jgi:hypothetical protein
MNIDPNYIQFMSQTAMLVNNLALKEERHLLTPAQNFMLDKASEALATYYILLRRVAENNMEKLDDSDSDSDAADDASVPADN